MRPWVRLYSDQPDWRGLVPRMWELRGGAWGWQVGVILPKLSLALWSNQSYELVWSYRWQPACNI